MSVILENLAVIDGMHYFVCEIEYQIFDYYTTSNMFKTFESAEKIVQFMGATNSTSVIFLDKNIIFIVLRDKFGSLRARQVSEYELNILSEFTEVSRVPDFQLEVNPYDETFSFRKPVKKSPVIYLYFETIEALKQQFIEEK